VKITVNKKAKQCQNFFFFSFVCFMKGCNFSEGYFFVRGAKFLQINRAEVDILFKCPNKVNCIIW